MAPPTFPTSHIAAPAQMHATDAVVMALFHELHQKHLFFFSILLYKISSNLSQNCVKKNEES